LRILGSNSIECRIPGLHLRTEAIDDDEERIDTREKPATRGASSLEGCEVKLPSSRVGRLEARAVARQQPQLFLFGVHLHWTPTVPAVGFGSTGFLRGRIEVGNALN
jgi:hypothetical protein